MRRIHANAILTLGVTLLVALVAGNAPAHATPQAAAEEAAKPVARAEAPIKDFGVVSKGEKLVHEFVIANAGDAPLEISEVRPECGCTVASFDRVIPAGGTGLVRAEVDTTDLGGAIAKAISVFTSDPANPRLVLTFKADVRAHIAAHPGYARYITVQQEREGTITQTIWADDYPDLQVLSVESPYPFLRAEFRRASEAERNPDGSGNQWLVSSTIAADAPVGPLADYLVIHTDHPEQKVVRIPVSGFVRPVIAVTPSAADFGERSLAEPYLANLVVKNFATEEIALTAVETDVKGVDAEIIPLQEGRSYQVRVTLKPGMPKGEFQGTLTLRTSSAKVPVVEVDLKGTVL